MGEAESSLEMFARTGVAQQVDRPANLVAICFFWRHLEPAEKLHSVFITYCPGILLSVVDDEAEGGREGAIELYF